jgi:integrase
MHFLDAVQVEQLAEAIDPRYRLLVLVGAYTGLRPGEITGLKIKRLDLLRGKVEVAEALSEVDGSSPGEPRRTTSAAWSASRGSSVTSWPPT